RAVEIDHHYDVAVRRAARRCSGFRLDRVSPYRLWRRWRREQFRVPAIRPGISPRPLRPAMNQKFQWIFLIRIESRRLDHESLHLLVIRAFEGERLQLLHVDLRQQRVVHVGDDSNLRRFLAWEYTPDFVRRG